ncbi:MAG: Rrf2 family transcriptional regulator [Reichenbachiella sp.]|uniref:Rrf2 family transcriptional regulator n=1 Tax=Reichenbachiella sp. TaxID=2184521 RepID=UPI0032677558
MQASANFTKAIHICIYINLKGKLIPSSQLAESLKTNPVVVRRLIALLRKHNIIGSVSGSQGGFHLLRPAKEISLWNIFEATKEEEFFHRPKVNHECVVSSNLSGLLFDAFQEAERSMKPKLKKVSIAFLTNKLKKIIGEKEVSEAIKGVF